jgi:hypothetical protein
VTAKLLGGLGGVAGAAAEVALAKLELRLSTLLFPTAATL